MERVRRAGTTALALGLALTSLAGPVQLPAVVAATVAWPVSTLVISEVQTGGATASDEFVELANQGGGPVDLAGLEVVYATSSGSTVTRKAAWSEPTMLEPGRRVLIVNGAGSYGAAGDLTYTGGFAATGGAVALRLVGGDVIDAVGWGDAVNGFVEGAAAVAPPAGSSLERLPGGTLGNGTDRNDNALDFGVSASPTPQDSSAPPVPAPGPTATPTLIPSATPTATVAPTASPTPTPTVAPTASPTPTPTPSPTAAPTAAATPTPTPTPTPTAAPTPTPQPTPAVIAIAAARELADGSIVTLAGTLTTDLGALEAGRTAFLEDVTAGIAIYLDEAGVSVIRSGTRVMVSGPLDTRYGQRTIRLATSAIVDLGPGVLPASLAISTGAASEALEGRRIAVQGTIVGATDALADGTAVSLDDGTGPVRLVITPGALGGRSLGAGSVVDAAGPLGQRDSTGTGAAGYRLYVTRSEDLVVAPPPPPTPTPTPEPSPTPTPTPSPTGTPTPSSSPSPVPSPSPSSRASTIAAARTTPIGATITVQGVVTAEAGRLGTPALLAIQDTTGGIAVRWPDGLPLPGRGRHVTVTGVLADPYGQLQLRPSATGVSVGGIAPLPAPIEVASLGEGTEGRLVRIVGTVVTKPSRSTSGDVSFLIETAGGATVKVLADASSGLTTGAVLVDARYRSTGIAGQRATKKGALDGYRVWLRDGSDMALLSDPSPPPTAAPSGTPTPKPSRTPKPTVGSPAVVSIAAALRVTDRDVAIEAIVTAGASLLDTTGRRIVAQDASGAIEILVPRDVPAPGVGVRIRVDGRVGSAYGAPRLRAARLETVGSGVTPVAVQVHGALGPSHTWRLVRVAGRIDDVRKLGDRWRADVVVGSARIAVVGQPGAAIPVGAVVEGRAVQVTGVVRPAYPSASDRRATLLPRSTADVRIGAGGEATRTPSAGAGGPAGGAEDGGAGTGGHATPSGPTSAVLDPTIPDADLATLADVAPGSTVRVGGLVVALTQVGFELDDGTAVGQVELAGEALEWLGLIEPGDAINVVGVVTLDAAGTVRVVVSDPAAIIPGSDLGDAGGPGTGQGSDPPTSATPAPAGGATVASLGDGLGTLPGAGAGIAGLGLLSLASVAVTVLRRRHARRLLTGRIASRLAAFTAPGPHPPG